MTFGLSNDVVARLHRVFARHLEIERVVIYGSRAKGNFREGSDIDLTFIGDSLDLSLLLKIENEIDDIFLPYKLDLSLLAHVGDPALRSHIARVGQILYERPTTRGSTTVS